MAKGHGGGGEAEKWQSRRAGDWDGLKGEWGMVRWGVRQHKKWALGSHFLLYLSCERTQSQQAAGTYTNKHVFVCACVCVSDPHMITQKRIYFHYFFRTVHQVLLGYKGRGWDECADTHSQSTEFSADAVFARMFLSSSRSSKPTHSQPIKTQCLCTVPFSYLCVPIHFIIKAEETRPLLKWKRCRAI